MGIHQSAIVDERATIGNHVDIGPYVVIEGNVVIGDRVKIYTGAYLSGDVHVGEGTQIHMGAVIGHIPQDVRFNPHLPSSVRIGKNNVIREYAQVHRSKFEGGVTCIGDNNYIMACTHIAHDCTIGNQVIVCNNSLLAGHIEVADKVFVSGNVVIHQYVRLGKLCFLQGGAAVSKDIPPYMIAGGPNTIIGMNLVGMRRNQFSEGQKRNIKLIYDIVYRQGHSIAHACEQLKDYQSCPEVAEFLSFAGRSRRGICTSKQNANNVEYDQGCLV